MGNTKCFSDFCRGRGWRRWWWWWWRSLSTRHTLSGQAIGSIEVCVTFAHRIGVRGPLFFAENDDEEVDRNTLDFIPSEDDVSSTVLDSQDGLFGRKHVIIVDLYCAKCWKNRTKPVVIAAVAKRRAAEEANDAAWIEELPK